MEIQYILRGVKYDYDVGDVKEIIGTFSSDQAALKFFQHCKSLGCSMDDMKGKLEEQYKEEFPIELIAIREPVPYKHLKTQLTKEQIDEYKFQNQITNAYNQGVGLQNNLIKTNYDKKMNSYVMERLKINGYSGNESDYCEYTNYEIESVKFFG